MHLSEKRTTCLSGAQVFVDEWVGGDNRPIAAHFIGGAIIENPCGVTFITPHGFLFIYVRAVASGESNRAETRYIPIGASAFIALLG
jgi:hypothetical protein